MSKLQSFASRHADQADGQHCPLCGNANACALADDASITACWCMQTVIAPQLLARVPDRARGRACLCSACVASHSAQATTP